MFGLRQREGKKSGLSKGLPFLSENGQWPVVVILPIEWSVVNKAFALPL